MDKFITTDNGGHPRVLDDLRWFLGQSSSDAGLYHYLQDFLKNFGDNFAVYGATYDGAGNISAGWVMLDGELLKVDAHTTSGNGYFEKVTTYDNSGQKIFQNGGTVDTYQKNRAIAQAASGNLRHVEVTATGVKQFKVLLGDFIINAAATRKGTQENSSDTEAQAQAATDKTIVPSNLDAVFGDVVKRKRFTGIWNMDTTATLNIAHGLTLSKIDGMIGTILSNAGTEKYEMPYTISGGGYTELNIEYTSTNIQISRRTGGTFDGPLFNNATYKIIIFYEL